MISIHWKWYFQYWIKNTQICACRILKMAPNQITKVWNVYISIFRKHGYTQILAHDALLMIIIQGYRRCLYLYTIDGCLQYNHQITLAKFFFFKFIESEEQTLCFLDGFTMAFKCYSLNTIKNLFRIISYYNILLKGVFRSETYEILKNVNKFNYPGDNNYI